MQSKISAFGDNIAVCCQGRVLDISGEYASLSDFIDAVRRCVSSLSPPSTQGPADPATPPRVHDAGLVCPASLCDDLADACNDEDDTSGEPFRMPSANPPPAPGAAADHPPLPPPRAPPAGGAAGPDNHPPALPPPRIRVPVALDAGLQEGGRAGAALDGAGLEGAEPGLAEPESQSPRQAALLQG
jgi:hypothetical protein